MHAVFYVMNYLQVDQSSCARLSPSALWSKQHSYYWSPYPRSGAIDYFIQLPVGNIYILTKRTQQGNLLGVRGGIQNAILKSSHLLMMKFGSTCYNE